MSSTIKMHGGVGGPRLVGGKYGRARGKTGKPECSKAMSDWKSGRASAKAVGPILGKCRAQARVLRVSGPKVDASKTAHMSVKDTSPAAVAIDKAKKSRTVLATGKPKGSASSKAKSASSATPGPAKAGAGKSIAGMPVRIETKAVASGSGPEYHDGDDHKAFLAKTKELTGLDGAGPKNGFVAEDRTDAAAFAEDHDHIGFGDRIISKYNEAMSRDVKDWDVDHARAVGVPIHEYTHTLGKLGGCKTDSEVFMEEASTEVLSRHAVGRMLEEGGGSKVVAKQMHETGAYSADVSAFRLMAKSVGVDPVDAARTLKGMEAREREVQIGKWLGARDPATAAGVGGSFAHHIGLAARMDRMKHGYGATPARAIKEYQKRIDGYKIVAKEVTPEVRSQFRSHFDHVDWHDPGMALLQTRTELATARHVLSKPAGTPAEHAARDRAAKKIETANKFKFVTDENLLDCFGLGTPRPKK